MSTQRVLERPEEVLGPEQIRESLRALDTFPKRLVHNAERFGDRVAFREKEFGIWQEITWRQYLDHVRACAGGLLALGMRRGDVVALIGDNRPELYYVAMATQALGGVSCGMYQDTLADQLAQLLDFADARFVFCEDQEQTDKLLSMEDRLPKVERVIVDDWRGMWRYQHPKLLRFSDLESLGREFLSRQPDRFLQEVARGRGDDVAIFCLTSGTTSLPKLAMLSHRNLLAQGENFLAVEPHVTERDEFVSFLPFAWIGEQMISFTLHQLVGFTVNFPEEPETAQRDLREMGPTSCSPPPASTRGSTPRSPCGCWTRGRSAGGSTTPPWPWRAAGWTWKPQASRCPPGYACCGGCATGRCTDPSWTRWGWCICGWRGTEEPPWARTTSGSSAVWG